MDQSAIQPQHQPIPKALYIESLSYVKECEHGRHGILIRDFKQKVLSFIQRRKEGTDKNTFTFTFEEYVIWEVRTKNAIRTTYHEWWGPVSCPWMKGRVALDKLRNECYVKWRMTPRYHAKIYRQVINDALMEAGISLAIRFPNDNNLLPVNASPTLTMVEPLADDDDSCVICMDHERSHAFVPCGHLIICNECAQKPCYVRAEAPCPLCCSETFCLVKIHQ